MNAQKKHTHKKATHTPRTASEQGSFHNLLQSALFGALCGMIAAVLLLFAATAICYATADPGAWTTVAGLAALYASSLVAGFAALRRHRSMALACGSLSGLFLLVVFLCLSLILRNHAEEAFAPSLSLLLRVLMIPSATVGGYLGLSRKNPKKRRVRK